MQLLNPRVVLAQLLQEKARRARCNRLQSYKPYPKQAEFHKLGASFRERLFSARNQSGKTFSGANETAMHLIGRYLDCWKGRWFDRPTVGIVILESVQLKRNGIQHLLLERVSNDAILALVPFQRKRSLRIAPVRACIMW